MTDLMSWHHDWDELCSSVFSQPSPSLLKLMDHRAVNNPEEANYIPPTDIQLHKQLRETLVKKIDSCN